MWSSQSPEKGVLYPYTPCSSEERTGCPRAHARRVKAHDPKFPATSSRPVRRPPWIGNRGRRGRDEPPNRLSHSSMAPHGRGDTGPKTQTLGLHPRRCATAESFVRNHRTVLYVEQLACRKEHLVCACVIRMYARRTRFNPTLADWQRNLSSAIIAEKSPPGLTTMRWPVSRSSMSMQLHRLGPVGNTDTTARFLTSFWDANVTASFSAADGFFGGPRAGADIPLAARVVAPAHRPAGGSISLVDATLRTVSQSRAILSEKRESPKPPRQHETR